VKYHPLVELVNRFEYIVINMVIMRMNCSNGFAVLESTILQWMVKQQKRRLMKSH
jgi:hypothetical protein